MDVRDAYYVRIVCICEGNDNPGLCPHFTELSPPGRVRHEVKKIRVIKWILGSLIKKPI
jgi:hypothetical protein